MGWAAGCSRCPLPDAHVRSARPNWRPPSLTSRPQPLKARVSVGRTTAGCGQGGRRWQGALPVVLLLPAMLRAQAILPQEPPTRLEKVQPEACRHDLHAARGKEHAGTRHAGQRLGAAAPLEHGCTAAQPPRSTHSRLQGRRSQGCVAQRSALLQEKVPPGDLGALGWANRHLQGRRKISQAGKLRRHLCRSGAAAGPRLRSTHPPTHPPAPAAAAAPPSRAGRR